MLIVTPGTQMPGQGVTDQARPTTPAEALRAGATHLVVGRAVARSSNPLAAFLEICEQCRAITRKS